MSMERKIGRITHYFRQLGVAVLQLDEGVAVGDTLHIRGHTTDFSQPVTSLEVDHRKLLAVGPGADVALKVDARVRAGDIVWKRVELEPAERAFGALEA
jgi:putative protease